MLVFAEVCGDGQQRFTRSRRPCCAECRHVVFLASTQEKNGCARGCWWHGLRIMNPGDTHKLFRVHAAVFTMVGPAMLQIPWPRATYCWPTGSCLAGLSGARNDTRLLASLPRVDPKLFLRLSGALTWCHLARGPYVLLLSSLRLKPREGTTSPLGCGCSEV